MTSVVGVVITLLMTGVTTVAGWAPPKLMIAGGTTARLGQFPYHVLITNYGRTTCGGVIIDENHVLSAAHCFATAHCYTADTRDDFLRVLRTMGVDHDEGAEELEPCSYLNIKKMALTAGISQTMTNEERATKQVRKIAAVYVSHQYISYTDTDHPALHNDLVVIRVTKPFTFTNQVQPARLPVENMELSDGQALIVTGFGATRSGGPTSSRLQSATVNKFSDAECDGFYNNVVSNSMFCAGHTDGGVDACQGDSGGPIGVNSSGRFTVLGIVSWGYGCANAGQPGVYTDLRKFLDFIEAARNGDITPAIVEKKKNKKKKKKN